MQLVLPVVNESIPSGGGYANDDKAADRELFNPHWTWGLLILSYLDTKSESVSFADMHRELSFCQSDLTDLCSVRLASQLSQLVKLEMLSQQSGCYELLDRGRVLIDEFHAFDRHIQQQQWDWRKN